MGFSHFARFTVFIALMTVSEFALARGVLIRPPRSPLREAHIQEGMHGRGVRMSASQVRRLRAEDHRQALAVLQQEKLPRYARITKSFENLGVIRVDDPNLSEGEHPDRLLNDLAELTLDGYLIEEDRDVQLLSFAHVLSRSYATGEPSMGGIKLFDAQNTVAPAQQQGVVVAVIDTGINLTHPDLQSVLWRNTSEVPGNGVDDDGNGYVDDINGYDFLNRDNNPADDNGHGTHVAGIIASTASTNNGSSSPVRLMPLKFLGPDGGGQLSRAIEAIDYAIRMGARIQNHSWGAGGQPSAILEDALGRAYDANVFFAIAAGNSGSNNDVYPIQPANTQVPSSLTVAAVDPGNRIWNNSNFGSGTVEIGAPGVNIYSTYPTNSYAYLTGTSMAAPYVAGVAALILATNPALNVVQVKDAIIGSADTLTSLQGKVSTGGRVNALRSVGLALGMTPAPLPRYDRTPASAASSGGGGACGTIHAYEALRNMRFKDYSLHFFVLLFPLALGVFLRQVYRRRPTYRDQQRFHYSSKVLVLSGEDKATLFHVLDISSGGVGLFQTDSDQGLPFVEGQRLRIRMQNHDGEWFDAHGDIQWVRPEEGRIGLQFVGISLSSATRLNDLLNSLSNVQGKQSA